MYRYNLQFTGYGNFTHSFAKLSYYKDWPETSKLKYGVKLHVGMGRMRPSVLFFSSLVRFVPVFHSLFYTLQKK